MLDARKGLAMTQVLRALRYQIERLILISPWRRRLKTQIRRVHLSHLF